MMRKKLFSTFSTQRELFKRKKGFLIDCDGVIYHGNQLLPGAKEFISFLQSSSYKYLFLTNASFKSHKQLAERLKLMGVDEKPTNFFSSIDSTAIFLANQLPNARCFVIGEDALKDTLRFHGLVVCDTQESSSTLPDYVVVGETQNDEIYNFSAIDFASNLVLKGAKLIGTNIDVADRVGNTLLAGTGSLIKPIEYVTGKQAFFPGKPNALMATAGLAQLGLHSEECIMVGDRMDTDIQLAVQSGLSSILVLSGITKQENIDNFSFHPTLVLPSVKEIVTLLA